MKLVTDEKKEGSKFDLKDFNGETLHFSLRPCGCDGCHGTIVYTLKGKMMKPEFLGGGEMDAVHNVLECCVKRNRWNPAEFFLKPKQLILRRIKMVQKEINSMNAKHKHAEDMTVELEG